MIKIGMLIADRYEILDKVGNGGMSDVYKAKDQKLNRLVAIKVLKQEFSENANFVSKFRVEAQAAAGLMHPNIVNVYDVGEEKGIYYIVMELVDGITLKKYIESKGRLNEQEAVTIAIQVAMGLEAAHRNHIIHRDIKPQNIIISKEGKVKVTDFGIAKIATSNTITSNVMGSVHYTSPEQARGGYSDAKSDIYSLGITLFEMLTGRVPYTGETTVAIAIKHIQEPMPSPRQYVHDLPYSIEQIVMKCCEKSPDKRYQNISELVADLKHSMIDPDGDFVTRFSVDDLGATRAVTAEDRKTIKEAAEAAEAAAAAAGTAGADAVTAEASSDRRDRRAGQSEDQDGGDDVIYDEYLDDEENHRTERMTAIISIAAAIVIGLVIIFFAANRIGLIGGGSSGEEAVETTKMPNVIGKTEQAASEALRAANLIPDVVYETTDRYDPGYVIAATEEEGSKVQTGTIVTITVSMNDGVPVPLVLEMEEEEAVEALESAGFTARVETDYSEDVEEGIVMSQTPDGNTKAQKGSEVTITVSLGPDLEGKVEMISLVDLSETQAKLLLEQMGLRMGRVTPVVTYDHNQVGIILSQTVKEGVYVDRGTAIDVEVGSQMTYSYTASINKPSANDGSQGADYVDGTIVHIVVKTVSGQVLLETDTATFPFEGTRYTGISDSAGVVTLSWNYTYQEEVEVEVDQGNTQEPEENTGDNEEEGGESSEETTPPAPTTTTKIIERSEPRSVTRTITFTPEY